MLDSSPNGLLHSEISGSKCVCHSPELIAAYHVLHRLAMPRHPPCALLRLVVYFKSFRFEATSSVQFLLALKLNILVCLVFSISSVVKERKSLQNRFSFFVSSLESINGGRDRSRTCDLVLIRDAL